MIGCCHTPAVVLIDRVIQYTGLGTERFVEDRWNLFDLSCVVISFGASLFAVAKIADDVNPFSEVSSRICTYIS